MYSIKNFTGKEAIGIKAIISVEENVLTITSKLFKIVLIAQQDNYCLEFNTQELGGEYVYSNGAISIINQKSCPFVSGQEYKINVFEFFDDLEGEAPIKYGKYFAMLYLELININGEYCDITLTSEKILVNRL